MRSDSVLSKSFTISFLFHAGLLGGLLLFVSRSPVVSDTPLRIRILESPGPGVAPQPPPEASAPPKSGRGTVEPPRRSTPPGKSEVPTERLAPRPVPVPDRPAVSRVEPPVAPPPPAQATARPAPEASVPTPKAAAPPPSTSSGRAAPIEEPAPSPSMTPAPPERGGLFLGGPSPSPRPLPPASSEPTVRGAPRPSLRDQIAGLGTGLAGDVGEAKRTINLDDTQPDYSQYLMQLKRRVYKVWQYPEEAGLLGLGGEVQLLFTLNKAGTLTNLRLVQSSGFPVLDNEALRAIRAAAPFDPFPPQMGDEPMNIRGTFQYVSHARSRRN